MIITSRNDLAGYRIVEEFGLVRGSTIRARHLGRDLLAGLKTIVGGEIQEYTKMMADSARAGDRPHGGRGGGIRRQRDPLRPLLDILHHGGYGGDRRLRFRREG